MVHRRSGWGRASPTTTTPPVSAPNCRRANRTRGSSRSSTPLRGESAALPENRAAITRGKHVIPHTDGTVKNTASSSQEFALALETGVAGDWVQIVVLGSNKTVS